MLYTWRRWHPLCKGAPILLCTAVKEFLAGHPEISVPVLLRGQCSCLSLHMCWPKGILADGSLQVSNAESRESFVP